jgi:quercetin dioxygenase-like cupin family protein
MGDEPADDDEARPGQHLDGEPGPVPRDQAVIIDSLGTLQLGRSQPVIYDRPVSLRLLYQDPKSGAEHYLIRYPAGLRARSHRHTAAHTVVVLEGRLEANGQVIGPGSYCHFPASQPMHHAPADGGSCLFVTIFHGPFDVQALDG